MNRSEMKNKTLAFLLLSIFSLSFSYQAYSDETHAEKAQALGNDAKRAAKKAANRVSEALCAEGDVKCAAKKVKNRMIEAKDSTVDAAKKAKNIVD